MFTTKCLTKNGEEKIDVFEYTDIKFLRFFDVKKIRKKNKNYFLLNTPIFLDTETSKISDNTIGWIYQWAFTFAGYTIVGRNVEELMFCLRYLSKLFKCLKDTRVVIYVHNLSYDIVYLQKFLIRDFGNLDMFAMSPHKILTVKVDIFEFRCSYIMSNMSLDKWTKNNNTYHIKAVGYVDYNILRYSDTPLSEKDWIYMISDVLAQKDAWFTDCEKNDMDVSSIPLTSTGFVRKKALNFFRKDEQKNRKKFLSMALTPYVFEIAQKAFSGGYTHGNRFFGGKEINHKIGYFDFRSFYPSTLLLDYYPSSNFSLYCDLDDNFSINELDELIDNYCCLIVLVVKNVVLKKEVTAPILSAHKVYAERLDDNIHIIKDNGRVLKVDGTFVWYGTELDYKWFKDQYNVENVLVKEVYIAEKALTPDWFRELLNDYFFKKTSLKNVDDYYYNKSKNEFNGIYGMCATNPVKDNVIYDFLTGDWKKEKTKKTIDDFYKSRNSFMSYQYGVWCTSHCRDRLLNVIKNVIGYDNYVYSDTDSIFFVYDKKIIDKINLMNEKNLKDCIEKNAYIEYDGDIVEYMKFEQENYEIKTFKFLHSKCYGFITNDDKLHLTIAGVTKDNKKDGKEKITREMELENLDNLKEGFTFKECGGTATKYNISDINTIYLDGHKIIYADSAIIYNIEKNINNDNIILDIWESED